jgi:hypothetical protein
LDTADKKEHFHLNYTIKRLLQPSFFR